MAEASLRSDLGILYILESSSVSRSNQSTKETKRASANQGSATNKKTLSKTEVKHRSEVPTFKTAADDDSDDDKQKKKGKGKLRKLDDNEDEDNDKKHNRQRNLRPIKEETDDDDNDKSIKPRQRVLVKRQGKKKSVFDQEEWSECAWILPGPTGNVGIKEQGETLTAIIKESFPIARISVLLNHAWPDTHNLEWTSSVLLDAAGVVATQEKKKADRTTSRAARALCMEVIEETDEIKRRIKKDKLFVRVAFKLTSARYTQDRTRIKELTIKYVPKLFHLNKQPTDVVIARIEAFLHLLRLTRSILATKMWLARIDPSPKEQGQ
ncbi:hypothetical protein BDN72DRAFT_942583, partial [Pluteus cervinus]